MSMLFLLRVGWNTLRRRQFHTCDLEHVIEQVSIENAGTNRSFEACIPRSYTQAEAQTTWSSVWGTYINRTPHQRLSCQGDRPCGISVSKASHEQESILSGDRLESLRVMEKTRLGRLANRPGDQFLLDGITLTTTMTSVYRPAFLFSK